MTQKLVPVLSILALIAACTRPVVVDESHYVHLIYQHAAKTQENADPSMTVIFIEGDGIPWVAHGTRIASDPTPIHALAYNLYKQTPHAAWYVTRPCYNHVKDSKCSPKTWTDARYSEEVVSSMVSAVTSNLRSHPSNKLVLVGYSGGGTLAVLMAPHIPQVAGVVTIAGNLDIDAWTHLHGYQPLNKSLNPSSFDELTIPHVAMIGERDTNIPLSSISGYLQSHPHTIVKTIANYDHVCCWEENWPALLDAALAQMHIVH